MGTDVLFVEPSFERGAARVVDLFGQLTAYNLSSSAEAADCLAIFADFAAVGGDLTSAMESEEARLQMGLIAPPESEK